MVETVSVFEGGRINLPPGVNAERVNLRLLESSVGGRSAFSIRKGIVYAGEFAGAIDTGLIRVEVLPKPFGVDEIKDARRLLLGLLKWAGGGARVSWLPGQSATTDKDLLEVVQQQAAKQLLELLELGSPRRYRPVEDVSPVVRGSIIFSRYARQLPSDAHRIPTRHSPLTSDNDLGRLLKSLATFLWNCSKSYGLRRNLDYCLSILNDVADKELTPALVQKVRLSRFESDWKHLVDLAEILASGKSPDPTRSGNSKQPTLLFSLNLLFEQIIRRVLAKHLSTPFSCPLSKGGFKLLTVPKEAVNALSISPDLIFRMGGEVIAVGDVKWKVLKSNERRHGVSTNDVYQLLTYMRRLGVDRGILFFPQTSWMSQNWITSFEVEPNQTEKITIISVDIASLVDQSVAIHSKAKEELASRVETTLVSNQSRQVFV